MNLQISSLIFILLLASCQTLEFPNEEVLNERELLRSDCAFIENEWIPASVNFDRNYKRIRELSDRFTYYPVWFNSINYEMHGIIFEPDTTPKDTVLIIHGYAGNILGHRYIINSLLEKGYRVAALMLPGHSINDNPRGDIEDFTLYGTVVKDYITSLNKKGIDINYAIGHSTGATSLLIYNEIYGWDFKRVVFIAPLIRSSYWYPSRFGRFISKPFISYYNTDWRGPLAIQVFPMHWFDKLVFWNKNNRDYITQDSELLLIQGKKDNVVDWRYNTKYIEKLYPRLKTIYYKDGDHTLFLKDTEYRDNVILNVVKFIDEAHHNYQEDLCSTEPAR